MEEGLVKLQNFFSKKRIQFIDINAITNTDGEIIENFDQRMNFDSKYDYYVSLIRFQCTSFFPNISEYFKNNKFYYSLADNIVKEYTFLNGAYEIKDISEIFKNIIGNEEKIKLTFNAATGRSNIFLANGIKIYFDKENTIRDILGFDSIILDQTNNLSSKMLNVLKTGTIYIDLDLIEGSIYKGQSSQILYSFPNKQSYGQIISINPRNIERKKLYVNSFKSLKLRFYDDNGNKINFLNTAITLTLEISQV